MALAPNNSCFSVANHATKSSKFSPALWKQLPKIENLNMQHQRQLGISETFSNLKTQGKVAFIPYITAGDPDLSATARALKVLDHCGADVIELGLPFSDPIADGPVIQASNKRALASKTNIRRVISMLNQVVPQISCPITIFSYYNLILKHDITWFLSALQDGGVQGLLVPDLPFEVSGLLRNEAAKRDIDLVMLTTPTTKNERMKDIAESSKGFLYLVSSNGVTGPRPSLNPQVQHLIKEIKKETTKPIVVGFGISKLEHVKQLSLWGADGVIVGSSIVKLLGEAASVEEGLRKVENFVLSLITALP